jgi:hypothetical protein
VSTMGGTVTAVIPYIGQCAITGAHRASREFKTTYAPRIAEAKKRQRAISDGRDCSVFIYNLNFDRNVSFRYLELNDPFRYVKDQEVGDSRDETARRI